METETPFDPRHDVVERLAFARQLFTADVMSMTHDQLLSTHGGVSRNGYDFLYELVGFFDTFAGLMSKSNREIEGPQGGWVKAPSEFCDRESACVAMSAAADRFVSALQNYNGDYIRDSYDSPVGPFTPLSMANLAVWHLMYHSGQLNYIQTIDGDADFHWIPEGM